MWFPLAILSALISGGRRVYDKHLTNTFGNFAMGFVVQAFSLLPSLALVFILPNGTDIGGLPWRFWWPLLIIWLVLYPVQTYFMYRAIREADMSTVTPVMCLLPVFNVFTSYFLLHEVPSGFGLVGIIFIVFGTYIMLRQNKKSADSRPVLFMMTAMFCIAIGTSLDKISIQVSNPAFYGFMNTLGSAIVFFILIHLYKEKNSFVNMRSRLSPLFLMGVFQAISYTATMYAFKYGPVSYVLAIKAGSYIMAGIYGIIILNEPASEKKMVALGCFTLGVLFLAIA